jgi:cysteine desulfurase/selenocysteine lyase
MATVHGLTAAPRSGFDVERVRADFPILHQVHEGRSLVYLDNAATSQKPQQVIDAVTRYYEAENANIHRGVYRLSAEATLAYEHVRAAAQQFLNAADPHEIIFVRGTTEAVNLVAQSFVRPRVVPGDEVLISHMEHHSNIVPWQLVAEQTGATLRVIPMTDDGELDLDALPRLFTDRTKFVSVVHISNSLGTLNPVEDITAMARDRGVPILIDGAQAAPHMPIDVGAIGCDFYAVSGHKMFGPTGIGVLYGRAAHLASMPPYHGGGEMIRSVSFDGTTYAPAPAKFEAGTPNIAGVVGLGAALRYLKALDWTAIQRHEADLRDYATAMLLDVPGIRIVGNAARKASVISFVMDGVHAHDIGTILDQREVAIRAGHHCTQPVMDRLGVAATARASFAFYNTRDDVDRLVSAVQEVREVFGL